MVMRVIERIVISGVRFKVMGNVMGWAQIIVQYVTFNRGLFDEKHCTQ
jgi:hypothetical protein